MGQFGKYKNVKGRGSLNRYGLDCAQLPLCLFSFYFTLHTTSLVHPSASPICNQRASPSASSRRPLPSPTTLHLPSPTSANLLPPNVSLTCNPPPLNQVKLLPFLSVIDEQHRLAILPPPSPSKSLLQSRGDFVFVVGIYYLLDAAYDDLIPAHLVFLKSRKSFLLKV
uniref:Uncharacterized protein n=1 Tax=Lactuca sativa TaxID=4236 RepID=A0A9R1XI17_LACSA|nr:hypothetical protein LSAT_V11C400210240 [Lactuca sativa]